MAVYAGNAALDVTPKVLDILRMPVPVHIFLLTVVNSEVYIACFR